PGCARPSGNRGGSWGTTSRACWRGPRQRSQRSSRTRSSAPGIGPGAAFLKRQPAGGPYRQDRGRRHRFRTCSEARARPPVSGVLAFSRASGGRQVMVASANRLECPSRTNGTFGGAARPHFVTSGLGDTFMSDEDGPDPERLLRLARAEDGAALGQLLELYRGYLALLARLQIGRRLQGKV